MEWNRKTKIWVLWSLFTIAVLAILIFTQIRQGGTKITKMYIEIHADSDHRRLIDKPEVKNIIGKTIGYSVEGLQLQSLDLKTIEEVLDADDRIDNAELYIDKNGILNVVIYQRRPIVRIMNTKGSFYLDEKGDKVRHYNHQTIRVPIATGHIKTYSPDYLKTENTLKKVYDIAVHLRQDTFLTALVEQIDVDEDGKIVLVPKIGDQRLLMQEGYDLEDQFQRLKTLYKNGLPYIGWNRHSDYRLDLEGQITGTLKK